MTDAARLMLIVCFPWAGCILDLGRAGLQPPPDAGDVEPAPETPDPSEDMADPDDQESEPVAPYGSMDIDFSTPFILDGARMADSAYQQAHPNALIPSAAFTGAYGASSTVPSAGADATLTYAYHSVASGSYPAMITIGQQSSDAGGSVVNPLVALWLWFDDIAVQDYVVDPSGESGSRIVQLIVYEVMPDGESMCIIAYGVGGVLHVSVSSGTTALDGGTLALAAQDLLLYYPTETPLGDLTSTILEGGYSVCPRE
jgi:hypothetical protein